MCEVLLDRGANINYEMPRGRFTGQVATTGKGGKGGWYSAKNMEIGNGATSLHAAVENGHPSVVKVLLDRGASQGKWFILYIIMVNMLLDRGASQGNGGGRERGVP